MSGYAEFSIVRQGMLAKGTHVLRKPFTVDTLRRRVRKVLDAAP